MNIDELNQKQTYAIVPEYLFDALENSVRTDLAVIVKNGRIDKVCSASEITDDIYKLEMTGGTLIPGMIDAHVHLDDWELPYYLAYGITTVRDVGSNLDFILDIRNKAQDSFYTSPYIVCCGPFIDDLLYCHANMSWGMKNVEDVSIAIKCLKIFAVDQIKLYSDLTPQMAEKGVAEAKKSGFYVLGDFYDRRPGMGPVLDAAVRAGIDEFEHFHGMPKEFSQQAADTILEYGTRIVSTIALYDNTLIDRTKTAIGQKNLKNVPDNIVRYWTVPAYSLADETVRYCENRRKYLKYFIKNNAKLGIGTDVPCWSLFPGQSYVDELRIHVECGLSCADTLKLATIYNAKALGLEHEIGTIEAGKRADLAFVKGNPLTDISVSGNVLLTIKGGHLFDTSMLIEQSEKTRPVSNALRTFGISPTERPYWRADEKISAVLRDYHLL